MKRVLLLSLVLIVGGCDFLTPTPPGGNKPPGFVVPPIPVPPIPTPTQNPHDYGHPMLCSGPFAATSSSSQYGLFVSPGTCEFVTNGTDASQRLVSRPVIASMDDVLNLGPRPAETVPCSDLLAVFIGVAGNLVVDDDELVLARARADTFGVPVLMYFDNNTFHPAAFTYARPGDIIGVQGYPDVGREPSIAQAVARTALSLDLAHSQGHRVALIRPLYTRSGQWSVTSIVALQVPLTDLIVARPWVVIDGWFAYGRPSGIIDHPEFLVHAAWLEEAAR